MKKILTLILFTCLFSQITYADGIYAILANVRKLLSTQMDIKNIDSRILSSQQDIENLMKEVSNAMTSHGGWGSYQTHDYQSYGDAAQNWASVLQMADSGSGNGELGGMVNQLASQFPEDSDDYERGVNDAKAQKYYALKSQTLLAARAASQLDYNKIQDQISYQHMLQQQIDRTKDLKAAVDLNNRIQVESNLINLALLREASINNQQKAVNEQANVNAALANARFLTINKE